MSLSPRKELKTRNKPILFTFVKMFHILESVDYFECDLYVKLWAMMADLVIFAMTEKIEAVLRTTSEFTTLIAFKALEVVDTYRDARQEAGQQRGVLQGALRPPVRKV